MDERKGSNGSRLNARFADIVRELNELAEAASELARLSVDSQSAGLSERAGSVRRSDKALLKAAKLTYNLRRNRSKLFKDDSLFGEPAWDILLDLFIADLKGVKLSITDACIGSAVPSTTALRWITILQQADLLMREGDPRDARRAYVILTERGYRIMQSYFEQALDLFEQ